MKSIPSLLAAAIAVAAFSPVHAQEGEAATLQVNRGSVMVSQQGGEFASVSEAVPLQADSRIMLAEDSAGTVVYDSGCRLRLEDPGVHAVPAEETCNAMAAADTAVGTGTRAGITDMDGTLLLLGGTVAVAAILANMDGDDPAPPPVSP